MTRRNALQTPQNNRRGDCFKSYTSCRTEDDRKHRAGARRTTTTKPCGLCASPPLPPDYIVKERPQNQDLSAPRDGLPRSHEPPCPSDHAALQATRTSLAAGRSCACQKYAPDQQHCVQRRILYAPSDSSHRRKPAPACEYCVASSITTLWINAPDQAPLRPSNLIMNESPLMCSRASDMTTYK